MKHLMQLGMPSLIEKPGIRESIQLCKELELDFLELNMNLPQYQIGIMDADELRKAASNGGIHLTIHLDENLNVCDFNNRVADAYRNTLLGTIDLAKRMDVPILNMHMACGVYFTLPDRREYLFELHKERYLERLRQLRDACANTIGGSGIRICIENDEGYQGFMRTGVDTLLESDVFALTWDIGHDHASGHLDEAFIRERADRVAHMHIHDALGTQNHLELGTGEVDLADKLRFAQAHSCRCVIETKTPASLRASVNYLKGLLDKI